MGTAPLFLYICLLSGPSLWRSAPSAATPAAPPQGAVKLIELEAAVGQEGATAVPGADCGAVGAALSTRSSHAAPERSGPERRHSHGKGAVRLGAWPGRRARPRPSHPRRTCRRPAEAQGQAQPRSSLRPCGAAAVRARCRLFEAAQGFTGPCAFPQCLLSPKVTQW